MIIKQISTSELKPLLPSACCEPSAELLESIRKNGLISPLVVRDQLICDGNRRFVAARQLGMQKVNCIECDDNPSRYYAALNTHREISAYELAAITAGLPQDDLKEILNYARQPESPQLLFCLNYIREKVLPDPELMHNSLPLNVWRELAHLDEHIAVFAPLLLRLDATVGQKRSISQILRQLKRKGTLPSGFSGSSAEEIILALKAISQPRRTEALQKFEKALANASIPAATQVKIDPTFSRPGVEISINLKRHQLKRLEELKVAIEKIFEQVEEI